MSKKTEPRPNLEPSSEPPTHVVGVRFQAVGKLYHFDASSIPDLSVGELVVVSTSRGRQVGQVASVGLPPEPDLPGPLKPIERRATGRDLAVRKHWESKELKALITAREINAQLGLPIKLVKAEYSLDGKRLTFYYSEEHKETKTLRKRLAQTFRVKVEMRRIGPRDVAKILGGYGACGGPLCCSTFLTEFSPISIRMAKAQGISLNPSEITGMCGRLRCCLVYEYEQYLQARKDLPKQGKRVGTPHGEGKVVSLMPLKDAALVAVGDRTVEVHRDDIIPIEEWRALQAKAAQPCDQCTRAAPEPPAETQSTDAEKQPKTPTAKSTRRRRRRRRK